MNFYQNHESLIRKYTHKYTVCIKEGGAQLSDHPTLASAIREIELLEQQDKENNEYEENYYDIRRIDCSSTRYYDEIGTFISEYNEEYDCGWDDEKIGTKEEYEAYCKEWRKNWFKSFPTGFRYDIRCLDGGAWDRSTNRGSYATFEEALDVAKSYIGYSV